ncbi:MAG: M1 family metallopeptidase [Kofleriaceae bacterium]
MREVAVIVAIAGLVACKGEKKPPPQVPPPTPTPSDAAIAETQPGPDPASDANFDAVRVKHLSLDLSVDFTTRTLSGTAKLVFDTPVKAAPTRLDVGELAITKVTTCEGDKPIAVTYLTTSSKSVPGKVAVIDPPLPCVVFTYSTPKDAGALLWLDAELTAGKKQPMLFTQSQAILARTWIPLQDTPSVRFTYDATIRVPKGAMAVMSATNPQKRADDGVYRFTMDKPIPSYLMAMAVGDLDFKAIGPRTGVYAEPSVVDAAAYEFAEVEKMMTVGEKLYGPYRWGRYDILVLPPSFPFGGMENPKLSFLTPTVLTGDRALVGLLAHELAHSWSGNLVTNSTWNDVWLNEGFTTYVESRIMEELRGRDWTDMSWAMARMDLDDVVADPKIKDTRLARTSKPGEDPEGAPSEIAYDKGALFLRALEEAIGREKFDAFLRARFDRLAFTSTDSATFEKDIAPLMEAVKPKPPWTVAQWLHDNGVPNGAPFSKSARLENLRGAAERFSATGALPDATKWSSTEWLAFLRTLPKGTKREHLEKLDKKFALTTTTNKVVAKSWYPIAIAADMQQAAPTIEEYLVVVGRRYLVMTVYDALVEKGGFWRDLAVKSFERAKAGYHSITRDSVAKLLAEQKT